MITGVFTDHLAIARIMQSVVLAVCLSQVRLLAASTDKMQGRPANEEFWMTYVATFSVAEHDSDIDGPPDRHVFMKISPLPDDRLHVIYEEKRVSSKDPLVPASTVLSIDTNLAARIPAVSNLISAISGIFPARNDSGTPTRQKDTTPQSPLRHCGASIGCAFGGWGYTVRVPSAWYSAEQIAILWRANRAVKRFASEIRGLTPRMAGEEKVAETFTINKAETSP